MPIWLIQLLAVALKELQHTVRDKRMMGLLLIAPALQLGVFSVAVDFDVDRVPTLIVDHDRTASSRQHLRQLLADRTLLDIGSLDSDHDAERAIDSAEASAALIVPAGFEQALQRGQAAHLQILIDGTDPNRGAVAAAAAARYAREQTRKSIQLTLAERTQALRVGPALDMTTTPTAVTSPAEVVLLPRVLHNPRLRTAVYMVPGITALLLLVVTVIVTAMGLARERETGTLEQVMVTPMSGLVLLVGKLLPYVFIGLFDFLFALVVGTQLFGVPIHGPLLAVFLGTTAYLISTLGVGLLISTISRTQQQAFIGGFLFLLPAVLLGGVMTPLWGMPSWMLPVTRVNPVRYYVEILRGVLLRGSTLSDVAGHLLILLAIGLTVITFAAWRFKRTLA